MVKCVAELSYLNLPRERYTAHDSYLRACTIEVKTFLQMTYLYNQKENTERLEMSMTRPYL